METKQSPESSQPAARRELGDIPAIVIAMLVSFVLLFGLVAGCDATVFNQ